MKKLGMLLLLIGAAILIGACCHGPGPHHAPPCPQHGSGPCNCPGHGPQAGAVPGESAQANRSAIYWCGCGPDCTCNAVSTKPGKCGCGKELAGGHVVFIEGNTALVCTCGPQCSCKIDPNDHTKCGCGKPVKRIDLAGTDLYFCNCGGACGCNTISPEPGTCRCGMPLHQAK